MASHRRPGVLAGALRLRRPQQALVPAQRRPGIELVDGRTRVVHRVSCEALLVGRLTGSYEALCGLRVLAGSLADRGLRYCRECDR